jgi:hypothetical protein
MNKCLRFISKVRNPFLTKVIITSIWMLKITFPFVCPQCKRRNATIKKFGVDEKQYEQQHHSILK